MKTTSSLLKGAALGLMVSAFASWSALRAQDDDSGAGITISGTGSLQLSGGNGFSGSTEIDSGTLSMNGSGSVSTSGVTVMAGVGGTEVISAPVSLGSSNAWTVTEGAGTSQPNGTSETIHVTLTSGSSAASLFVGPTISNPAMAALYPPSMLTLLANGSSSSIPSFNIVETLQGSLDGVSSGMLNSGVVTLGGANTLNGATTIDDGDVQVTAGALSLSAATITYQPALVRAASPENIASDLVIADAVPEPSASILLAGALGLLAGYRRFKPTDAK